MNPGNQDLESVLQSAIVVSWADLMHGVQTGLIHVEYGFATGGTLDYLKLWSSVSRGHWLLACEYWMSASTFHRTGVHFDNGYHSQGLSHILESVMQHQSTFTLPTDLGRQGLLLVPMPTEEESAAAAVVVNETLNRLDRADAAPVLG